MLGTTGPKTVPCEPANQPRARPLASMACISSPRHWSRICAPLESVPEPAVRPLGPADCTTGGLIRWPALGTGCLYDLLSASEEEIHDRFSTRGCVAILAAVLLGSPLPAAAQLYTRHDLGHRPGHDGRLSVPGSPSSSPITPPVWCVRPSTDGSGFYRVPASTPAAYTVKFELQGFKAVENREVPVPRPVRRPSTARSNLARSPNRWTSLRSPTPSRSTRPTARSARRSRVARRRSCRSAPRATSTVWRFSRRTSRARRGRPRSPPTASAPATTTS